MFLRVAMRCLLVVVQIRARGVLEASRSPKYAVHARFYVQSEAPMALLEASRNHFRGPIYAVYECFYVRQQSLTRFCTNEGPKGSGKRHEPPSIQFIRVFMCQVKLQEAA